MRLHAVAAMLAVATTMLAPRSTFADPSSRYRVGFMSGTGKAFVGQGSEGGFVNAITYSEYSGWISKLLLLVGAAPRKPVPTISNVKTSTVCGVSHCYTTTTYDKTNPSEEDWKQYARDVEAFPAIANQIIQGGVPFVFNAEVLVSEGERGWMASLSYRHHFAGLLGFPVARLEVGMGFGHYSLRQREIRELALDGTDITAVDRIGTRDYDYAGMPIRFTGFLRSWLSAYLQLDLNFFGLPLLDEDDRHPSLTRVGLETRLGPIFVRGEVAGSAFHPDAVSLLGEAGIEF